MTIGIKASISAGAITQPGSLSPVLLRLPVNVPIRGSVVYGKVPSLAIKNVSE